MTRRCFLAGTAALAAAPAVLPRTARAQTTVKIGTAVLGDYSMAGPVIVAHERGFFSEHGLIKKKLPLDEHFTRDFTPVRV